MKLKPVSINGSRCYYYYYYYYYYYVAFNAPCVGHKDDESHVVKLTGVNAGSDVDMGVSGENLFVLQYQLLTSSYIAILFFIN